MGDSEKSGWQVLGFAVAFQEWVTGLCDRLRTPRGAEWRYIWVRGDDTLDDTVDVTLAYAVLLHASQHPSG